MGASQQARHTGIANGDGWMVILRRVNYYSKIDGKGLVYKGSSCILYLYLYAFRERETRDGKKIQELDAQFSTSK